MAMGLCFVLLLIFRFNPLIKVDEANDHVSILGGLIDVTGGSFTWNKSWKRGSSKNIEGFSTMKPGEFFNLKFRNGKVELRNSDESKVSWECRIDEKAVAPSAEKKADETTLDFSQVGGFRCEIEVPKNLRFRVVGGNGKIAVAEPRFSIDAELANGKVDIAPSEQEKYHYDLSVTNGKVDAFESSTDANAYSIKVKLANGKIDRSS
jgi:DUF4097 and DUF4098 domain-containing protein YvlB